MEAKLRLNLTKLSGVLVSVEQFHGEYFHWRRYLTGHLWPLTEIVGWELLGSK